MVPGLPVVGWQRARRHRGSGRRPAYSAIGRSTMTEHAMKHDDLVGGRSGIHLPDVDIPRAISKVDWPQVDLSSIDVGKAVRGAAAAAHIGRRRHRPRWPLAIGGLIVAALASWVILKNDALRTRLADAVGTIRDRICRLYTSPSPRDG